jgi:hypothetical protein
VNFRYCLARGVPARCWATTAGCQPVRRADAELYSGEFDLMMGELDGRAFLVDTSYVLSDSLDMIVAMSQRLGTVMRGGVPSSSYLVGWAFVGPAIRHTGYAGTLSATSGLDIGPAAFTKAR